MSNLISLGGGLSYRQFNTLAIWHHYPSVSLTPKLDLLYSIYSRAAPRVEFEAEGIMESK